MGLTNLGFTKTGDKYTSDVFTPDATNVTVRVKFLERLGAVTVERSINGVNWVVVGAIAGGANNSLYVLQSVCGFVSGEAFRMITIREPESIKVLK
ncbi:MAG: hypothetical protein LBL33_00460 [Tannerella sp.]|jgi:hypothetical protein|nr:hypothetical protein [Tannerella sp.]